MGGKMNRLSAFLLTAIILLGCGKDEDGEIDWFAAVRNVNFRQVDRIGFPGLDNFLVADATIRQELNQQGPDNDIASARESVRARVEAIRLEFSTISSGASPLLAESSADDVAAASIPNVLTIDLAASAEKAGGRQLEDDVYDRLLRLVFDRAFTDGIANSINFNSAFPFVPLATTE
jgi:hypothetical protein